MERLELPDGRVLEYLVEGPAGALPLVLHHGTPSGAVRFAPVFDAVLQRGLRVVVGGERQGGDYRGLARRLWVAGCWVVIPGGRV